MSSELTHDLVTELRRARALGENPAASPLWLHAPWGLRQRYADGYIDAEGFYRALTRWLEFERPRLDLPEGVAA